MARGWRLFLRLPLSWPLKVWTQNLNRADAVNCSMPQKKVEQKHMLANLCAYGLSHAVVEIACAVPLVSLIVLKKVSMEYFTFLLVIYNIVQFGAQPFTGLLVDKWRAPKAAAIAGLALLAVAVPLEFGLPLPAVIIAGLGNALFHVAGGTICINLTPKKASGPGLFVAPGALGILVGALIAKGGAYPVWPLLAALAFSIVIIALARQPEIDYRQDQGVDPHYLELAILLVFLAVAARSLVGSVVAFPWKTDLTLLVMLTLGIFLGKALGGPLADRFGWTKVAVGGLVLCSPMLAFGASVPFLGIIGIFLFNLNMPVTLAAISNLLPGRPGFAFGLTTFALLVGLVPTYTPLKGLFSSSWMIFVLILAAIAALFYGLRKYAHACRTGDRFAKGGY